MAAAATGTARIVDKGCPFPLGATLQRGRRELRRLLEIRRGGHSCCCSTRRTARPPTSSSSATATSSSGTRGSTGLKAGQLTATRFAASTVPSLGLRFNDSKLLLDPYAKAVTGKFRNIDNLLLAYDAQPGAGEQLPESRDNTAVVPKAIVVDDAFDWQGVRSPERGLEELVIYEVHVKGFTAHPSSGVRSPGTYLGFIEKIPYLTRLGRQCRGTPAGARILRGRLPDRARPDELLGL